VRFDHTWYDKVMQLLKKLARSKLFLATLYALILWCVHTLDPRLGAMQGNAVAGQLYVDRIDNHWYWYLIPNLILAAIPLGFSFILAQTRSLRLFHVPLLVLWLLFLPNSFYVITDFIHAQEAGVPNLLHITLLAFFSVLGWLYGLVSMRHVEMYLERFYPRVSPLFFVAFVATMSGVAIFLGRDLRLNSWDIFVRPLNLLIGMSGLFDPASWSMLFGRVLLFSPLIGFSYVCFRKSNV
jgi:uncharacterized membrane protein